MISHGHFAPNLSSATNWIVTIFSLMVIASATLKAQDAASREPVKITIVRPQAFTLTQPFIAQIRARRHVKIRALEKGYLWGLAVEDGQQVKQGDPLCRVVPIREQKNLDLAKADTVRAPFGGIVDHLRHQQGSLIEEGEILTTMSDDSEMWVYLKVPKADRPKFAEPKHRGDLKIELLLTTGEKFDQAGKIGAIEEDFNDESDDIDIRADFPNPDRRLHHGETGIVLISRAQKDALVIPQRAVLEDGGKRYVYVVDKGNVAHRREIFVQSELADRFVIQKGTVETDDRIVLDGLRHVSDGAKVQYDVNESNENVLPVSVDGIDALLPRHRLRVGMLCDIR